MVAIMAHGADAPTFTSDDSGEPPLVCMTRPPVPWL
jgi:hypothetical protein